METCEYAMWVIAIQVALFGIGVTVLGFVIPFSQNKKLKELDEKINELVIFKYEYENTLNKLKTQDEELTKKMKRKEAILQEEFANITEDSSNDDRLNAYANFIERLGKEGLLDM